MEVEVYDEDGIIVDLREKYTTPKIKKLKRAEEKDIHDKKEAILNAAKA